MGKKTIIKKFNIFTCRIVLSEITAFTTINIANSG